MNDTTKTTTAAETEFQLSLRVHARIMQRADELMPWMTDETGRACVRSDVLREALVRGLKAMEKEREK